MRRPPVITAVRTLPVSVPVRRELVVRGARGTHDRSDFLLVGIETDAGIRGIGEVSATLLWSGEDGSTARHAIDSVLTSVLVGRPLAPVGELEARMDLALAASPFTKAGVTTALWDAYSRWLDVPLAVCLGGPYRDLVGIKCSLSGDGDRLVQTYRAARAAGFTAFKVKVGLDVVQDTERLRLARELAGPRTFLGMDANGGYSRSDAARMVPVMQQYGIDFFEQPVHPDDLTGMARLRHNGFPVVADEAVFGQRDLRALVAAEAADTVSLYIGKGGGPGRAVAMAAVAAAAGIEVLIGSNGELGVGAAAQVQVACALPQLADIPSDIIGAFYYENDVLARPLPTDGTTVRLPDGPGLGVDLTDEIQHALFGG